jgi:hypothetical protein
MQQIALKIIEMSPATMIPVLLVNVDEPEAPIILPPTTTIYTIEASVVLTQPSGLSVNTGKYCS